MKKYVLLSAAVMLSIMLSAQTQQGYVKTKGRMVNGQHVPGQGLKGATVSIKGRTAVLVDTSGSMGWQVSSRSVATCRDIAAVMAALCTYISDDAWACAFDTRSKQLMFTGLSPIADINMVPSSGGGTDMAEGFRCLIKSGFDADRIVVLSDNEVNRGHNKETMQHWLEEYRRQMSHDVWCHAVDLQGYGTAQFVGHHVNVMAGWSENVLRFISLVERGSSSLVGEIERFDL